MLHPGLAASYAAVAGAITRGAASSVIGTTATPTTASSFLAFVWLVAPRAHTNGVNRPYRVQETCGPDSGYPCSCAVMIRAVQIKSALLM